MSEIQYRFLTPGEKIEEADEVWNNTEKQWKFTIYAGGYAPRNGLQYRRRIAAPASDWVLWSERAPTKEDADGRLHVSVLRPNGHLDLYPWDALTPFAGTLWRPTNPPILTAEQRAQIAAEKAGVPILNQPMWIAGYLAREEAK